MIDNVRGAFRVACRTACVALAIACLGLAAPLHTLAQEAATASIRVAASIAVAAGSDAELTIDVGPPDAIPPRSFLSLRGLPPSVALGEAHAVGPGSWAVPLSALPSLKAQIPDGLSGESQIVMSLIAVDGRLLAQARSALVITAPVQARPAVALSPAPPLDGEERARAERLLARGEAHLANGNIVVARDFFERAADAGLAASALRLAATYDPVELKRLKVQGVAADPALARKWYQRARELGAAEAAGPLVRLGKS